VRCLRNLGCDTVQGFLYARPMPADELVGWIEQRALH
jgi:EAL domain-containing protein (putative c-di-GMP-specific phosphodiesterase class I)